MILRSFGCSFIWGSDLAKYEEIYSFETWPALLAKDLGIPYDCQAVPGGGNLIITERILALTDPDDFIVVQWTYIDRYDFKYMDSEKWSTIRPSETNDINDWYYRHLYHQYQSKLQNLINIKTCIDHLNTLGCKFIMTYMDDLLFETDWHSSSSILALQNAIRPYMKTFDGVNMLEYSRKKGHTISEKNHPLKDAHIDLYQYAKNNFLKELQ